jgi:DNA-directed RNA polymerase specialized sigma24 family protein
MSTLQPSTLDPRPSLAHQEYERALVERSRNGEDIRDELILHMQPIIKKCASHLAARLSPQARSQKCAEWDDLVQSALVRMLDQFPLAMSKEEPLAYLVQVAKYAMWDQINGRSDPIKRHPTYAPLSVASLDAPLSEDGETLADFLPWEVRLPSPDTASPFLALEQAIAALPGKQRAVIDRHFGFHQHEPRSLTQIAREISPTSKHPRSTRTYKQALNSLQQMLTPAFPQYALAGGAR